MLASVVSMNARRPASKSSTVPSSLTTSPSSIDIVMGRSTSFSTRIPLTYRSIDEGALYAPSVNREGEVMDRCIASAAKSVTMAITTSVTCSVRMEMNLLSCGMWKA